MNENRPVATSVPRTPRPEGDDYEYDEAHDALAAPMGPTPAPHRVNPPPQVHLGQRGDYGYDEAHDFSASWASRT